jgi:hypothetical protein
VNVNPNARQRLIVYAKRPLPGYAKTRLGAAIGATPAAGVYTRLLYTYLLDLLRADLADTAIEISVPSEGGVRFLPMPSRRSRCVSRLGATWERGWRPLSSRRSQQGRKPLC